MAIDKCTMHARPPSLDKLIAEHQAEDLGVHVKEGFIKACVPCTGIPVFAPLQLIREQFAGFVKGARELLSIYAPEDSNV